MATTRFRWFALALCLGLCWLPAAGSSRLEFPRLALQAGQILGVAMVNPNLEPAEIMLTAFAADGTVLDNQPLQIAAESQLSFLAADIFAEVDLSQVGWFRADSSSNGLTGFFLYLDPEAGDLDGADLPVRARQLVFDQVEGSGDRSTEISLVNPGMVAANVTARLRVGGLVQQSAFGIPAHGATQFDPRVLFATNPIAPAGSLEITSDEDLLGFQILRFSEGDSAGLNARSSVQRLNRIFFPQMVLGGGFTNSLAIRNQSEEEVSVEITAHDPSGGLISLPENPRRMKIGAREVLRTTLAILFAFEGDDVVTGWLEVTAPRPAISGELVYRIEGGEAAAAIPGAESGSRRLLFSHLATTSDFFTGLAVLNPGRFPTALRGVSVSRSGEPLGRFDRLLLPGQRFSLLITELIPEAAGQNGGYIWIEADSPVFATGLFGNGHTLLANVPPQPSPLSFRADSTFPLRPVITPAYATATAGEMLQFSTGTEAQWRVDGVEGGSLESGLIDAGGLYAAPAAVTSSPASVSAHTDTGVGAAGIDLLSISEILAAQGEASAIAAIPSSGRVFFSASSAGPAAAGSETGHQLFEWIAGEAVAVVSLGFIPASISVLGEPGEERLVLVDSAGSAVQLFDPDTGTLDPVTSGPVSAAIYDPISRSLLVASGGSLRGIVDLNSKSGASTSRVLFSLALDQFLSSLAVNRCNGDILFTTSGGNLGRFRRSLATTEYLAEGLPESTRLLINYRQGVSCPDGSEVLLADGNQVRRLQPASNAQFTPWSPLDGVLDLTLAGEGKILALRQAEEGYRIESIENGMAYDLNPLNPPQVELLPVRSSQPGLDLELISTNATAGQSVNFNLYLRTAEPAPAALVFSIDLDPEVLLFDDTDNDQDGIPDAVLQLLPNGYTLFARYDPEDEEGELTFIIASLDPAATPLATGNLLSISFQAAPDFEGTSQLAFGTSPAISAADQSAASLQIDETLGGTVSVGRTRKR